MIEPKRKFGKKNFEVNEEFIDRDKAKELYRKKLRSNQNDYNILFFYGVGGIGKSKLRKEICRIHESENDEAIIMHLDLQVADDRNLGSGILKLADSCSGKVDFKCFELAYALYYKKKNPSASYSRDKTLLSEKTVAGIGLNIIGILDGGITSTATEIAERAIRAVSNITISKEVRDELKRFGDYSIGVMEEWLPTFFRYDLKCYQDRHPDAKFLVIFDTFEALNENVIEKVHRSRNERWVQDIIACFSRVDFPGLLFALFGRDKIEWGNEWDSLIDQYQLKEFDEEFSREYLFKAGVKEIDIVDRILRSSRGYPFLMYLSLETYANIRNNGEKPDAAYFGSDYTQIIERFLYNLDKDCVEVLRLMSIPNYYNVEVFKLLTREFNVSFPMTEFEQFNKYSFIAIDRQENDYYIHNLMRKGMLEKTGNDTLREVNRLLLNYYHKQFADQQDTKTYIEMIYHARELFDVEEYNKWFVTQLTVREKKRIMSPLQYMVKMQESGEQNLLIQIIGGIISKFPIQEIDIRLVNIYIDVVHLGGDYETAVSICDDYIVKFPSVFLSENEQLIKMRIRKIHHSMFFLPVDRLIADAESILTSTEVAKYPEVYCELMFLLGGNLGVLSGDISYSMRWLRMLMQYAKKQKFDSFILRTIRKQADILLAQNQTEEALELINSNLSLAEKIDSRYKIYLYGVLGEIYRRKADISKAREYYLIVCDLSAQKNIPGWRAHSKLGLAMIELHEKNFDEAESFLDEAASVYKSIKHEWGKINLQTATMILMKARGKPVDLEMITECKKEAMRLRYQYNVEFLGRFEEGTEDYFQLFFL